MQLPSGWIRGVLRGHHHPIASYVRHLRSAMRAPSEHVVIVTTQYLVVATQYVVVSRQHVIGGGWGCSAGRSRSRRRSCGTHARRSRLIVCSRSCSSSSSSSPSSSSSVCYMLHIVLPQLRRKYYIAKWVCVPRAYEWELRNYRYELIHVLTRLITRASVMRKMKACGVQLATNRLFK